ncbi:MAG: hypothetical protein Q7J73_02770 [Dehalococcoidales bacterium]|nr:hypothetical protein [Dehalococcoidales bacterium]
MMSLNDTVNAQEEKVDAGITKVQGVLEDLKQSSHSTWVLLVIGIIMLFVGVVIWLV